MVLLACCLWFRDLTKQTGRELALGEKQNHKDKGLEKKRRRRKGEDEEGKHKKKQSGKRMFGNVLDLGAGRRDMGDPKWDCGMGFN